MSMLRSDLKSIWFRRIFRAVQRQRRSGPRLTPTLLMPARPVPAAIRCGVPRPTEETTADRQTCDRLADRAGGILPSRAPVGARLQAFCLAQPDDSPLPCARLLRPILHVRSESDQAHC